MSKTEAELRADFRAAIADRWSVRQAHEFENISDWRERWRISMEWDRWLASRGWLSLDWPTAWGGSDLAPTYQACIHEELAVQGAPPLANHTGWIAVGPLLIDFGTDQQRERFLPGILDMSAIWCQAFSEPDAGSDLYSLRTSLRADSAGGYTLSGHKIWASHSPAADFAFVLCQDDRATSERPADRLSIALVDLHAPGVQVTPIRKLTGEDDFGAIFFDDVRLDESSIVGAPGMGRQLVMRVLGRERSILWRSRYLSIINRARELTSRNLPGPLRSDAQEIRVRADALMTMVRATAADLEAGQRSSVIKIYGSQLDTAIARLSSQVYGTLYRDFPTVGLAERHQREWIRVISTSVAAGSDEIQLETVAKLLGLGRGAAARPR